MVNEKKDSYWNRILKLFIGFFKIGMFTFGGGYAMISLIHGEIVDKHKWIDDEEMLNIIIIAESTPGVLAVNAATFAGYRVAGVFGSAVATIGVTLPSVIIICIISLFFYQFKSLKYVSYAFNGIRAGVVLLIINAVKKLDKKNIHNLFYFIVVAITVILTLFLKVSAVYVLLVSVVLGIIYNYCFKEK